MCANCVTGTEALAINAMALAAAGSSIWERLRSPLPREVVQRRVYHENARWLASFGLDPDAVLGPVPSTTTDPVDEVAQVDAVELLVH